MLRHAALLASLGVALAPGAARANGAYTHVHVSQLAHERLPAGELRALLSEPDAVRAYEAGSMFPDSGYAVDDAYGELAHWEPFVNAYVAFLRRTYGGDYGSPEARTHVAFLMGVASHGLADQSYDTTLLERAFEIDGPEHDAAPVDQFADYFLVVDEAVVFTVEAWAPYADMVTVIEEASGRRVEESLLLDAMNRMESVTGLQSDPRVARRNYWTAWEHYPFLGTHVYAPDVVGSVPWLAGLVAEYWAVLWRRLHETDDVDADLVLRTVPEDGATNWPVDLEERGVYGRIALWFGYGIDRDQLTPRLSLRRAATDEPVEVSFATAYGGRERNLVFVVPNAPLAYDTEYTVEVGAGVETLSGETSTAPHLFSFRTRCADDRLADCPPLDPPLMTGPVPERPEPGPRDGGAPVEDAGPGDGTSGGCAVGRGPAAGIPAALLLAALAALARARRRR
jgi:MYXO-CTERM domain-containing protein